MAQAMLARNPALRHQFVPINKKLIESDTDASHCTYGLRTQLHRSTDKNRDGTLPSEKVEFTNDEGVSLAAILDSPDEIETRACALFAHCFTCSKDLRAVRTISNALSDEGIAVLRFDFTGLGESEGEFSESNFSSNVSDIVAAARFLAEEQGGPSILVGHSLGGAAVLRAAEQLESVKAVADYWCAGRPRTRDPLVVVVRRRDRGVR